MRYVIKDGSELSKGDMIQSKEFDYILIVTANNGKELTLASIGGSGSMKKPYSVLTDPEDPFIYLGTINHIADVKGDK